MIMNGDNELRSHFSVPRVDCVIPVSFIAINCSLRLENQFIKREADNLNIRTFFTETTSASGLLVNALTPRDLYTMSITLASLAVSIYALQGQSAMF